jgi:hypothetical protein
VSHAEFVEAFYTGGLFKVERFLLRVFISRPSTDLQARQLAAGELNEFAAWRVEARAVDQVLLCAIDGRTRSWLMVSAAAVPGRTRLYFGSAVVPKVSASAANPSTGIRRNFPHGPGLEGRAGFAIPRQSGGLNRNYPRLHARRDYFVSAVGCPPVLSASNDLSVSNQKRDPSESAIAVINIPNSLVKPIA